MRLGLALGFGWGVLAFGACVGPISWQQYQGATSPEVAAIREHPVRSTGTVVEPFIDGFGGDPAVQYRYHVAGHTYDGYDIGNAKTGDTLSLKPGQPVSIVYAASMPQVSCLAGSEDCPNDIYDPEIPAVLFWVILIAGSLLGGVGVGAAFAVRAIRRRGHKPLSDAPTTN